MKEIRIKRDLGPVIRTYLIGSMESCGEKGSIGEEWREKCVKMLSTLVDEKGESVYVFNPVKLEKLKTGRTVKENLEYMTNLKRGGSWKKFKEENGKIWYGILYEDEDGVPHQILGDRDFVFHSTFLIMHFTKGDQPIGTIREMTWATDMAKPIYLITSVNKSDLKDSLLGMLLNLEEHIFQNFNQLKEYLKKQYKLKDKIVNKEKK